MATRNERLQMVWHRYEREREHRPSSPREAVQWAVAKGMLQLPAIDPFHVLAGQMASALRQEIQTDDKGRKYRVNHAVRVTTGGAQRTFWAMMGYAPHEHMERAFTQRREQIVGDAVKLKTDIDVYNDRNAGMCPQVQLILDLTDDVAEREQLQEMQARRLATVTSISSNELERPAGLSDDAALA